MKRFAFAAVVVVYAAVVFGLQAVLPPEAVISRMTQRVLSEAGRPMPSAAAHAANPDGSVASVWLASDQVRVAVR